MPNNNDNNEKLKLGESINRYFPRKNIKVTNKNIKMLFKTITFQ